MTGAARTGQAGLVAVRAADLASPAGPGLGKDGRSALVAAGGGRIRSGDVVVFLKPVAVAPAVVRRDGRVQAGGHPADHARLGVAEDRLDALASQQDVIGQIAAGVRLGGKVKGAAQRAMTPALTIRLALLMTLMPGDADYAEVLAAVLGDLALVLHLAGRGGARAAPPMTPRPTPSLRSQSPALVGQRRESSGP